MTFKSAVPFKRDLTLKNRVPGSCCKNTFATVSGLVVMLLPSKASMGPGMRIVVGTAPIGTSYGFESSRMAFRMTPRGGVPSGIAVGSARAPALARSATITVIRCNRSSILRGDTGG